MGPLPLLLKLSNHWLRSGCEPQSPPGTQPLASPSLWGGLQSLGVPHLFPTASPVTFCVPTSSRLPELAADFLPVPLLTTSPAPSSPQLAGSPYETRPNQNLSPFPVKPSQNIICLILMNNRHLLSPQKETGQTPPFLSFLHGFESSPGTLMSAQLECNVHHAPYSCSPLDGGNRLRLQRMLDTPVHHTLYEVWFFLNMHIDVSMIPFRLDIRHGKR